MNKFSYGLMTRIGIIYMQVTGVIGLILSTGMAIFSFWGFARINAQTMNGFQNPQYPLLFLGFFSIIIGWTVSFSLINSFPSIWLEDSGLRISAYIFWKIFIPWEDIVDIHVGNVRFGHDLVRARKISFFHRYLGWIYSFSILPSFIIRKNIQNHDLLVSEIRKQIKNKA